MAGRGTDIELSKDAHAAGGLHVILTSFHETSRIDRQLEGRAGRQGDPGSAQAINATDDELYTLFAPRARKSVVSGKEVSVRVDLGGRRIHKKKKHNTYKSHSKKQK